MGRSPRAPALAAVLALVALIGPAAAISSVFTATGNTFVLSTPEWTLMSPFSATGGGTGVFYNATSIFTFTAPKNKGPQSKDGTTVKRATTMRFNKIALTPATVAATGLQPIAGAVGPMLTLRVKLQKGSLVPQKSASFAPQGTAFPYNVLYGGASQVDPKLLTPNTGAKILGKPQLKYGKSKPVKISTASPTFQLTTAGIASAVCADGYGGAIGTASSGCAQCTAGSYASKFDQSEPCKLCSTVSSNSISAQAGAASCANCTAGTTPNANGTACVTGNGTTPVTPATTSFAMTAPAPCSDVVRAQIKASQEAFLLSQPGVQSVTVTVTCTAQARRRALLQTTNGTVVYTSTVTCTGSTSSSQCTAGFTALGTQVSSCCPRSASCTTPLLTPTNCTGTTTACAANFYNRNGTCVSCGAGATSPGGAVTSCTCTNNATWSSTTGCPTGATCAPGTYTTAGTCAPCPANSYCLGGVGAAAVATPCPGTTSTNGATAQTSVLGCAQGNSFKTLASNAAQNWTSIAAYGGLPIGAGTAPTEGDVRVAAAANGLLYGTINAGVAWSAIGPDSTNRTWTAVSTCQATTGGGTTATAPLAVIAVAANGGAYLAVATDAASLPTGGPAGGTSQWVKLSGGTSGPADSLAYTSAACASVPRAADDIGAQFYVLLSSGGSGGQLWLGSATITVAAPGTPAANTFNWYQVSGSAANVPTSADFSSVAAAVAGKFGAAGDKQGLALAATVKGATGDLFTSATASGSLPAVTSPGSILWTARGASITVGGVQQRNFTGVDIASAGGTTAVTALRVVAAVGGGRVFSSTSNPSDSTWYNLAPSDQPWTSVDLNFAGTAVAAAASSGGIWYSGDLANANTLANTTVSPVTTQANQVGSTQAWTDVALIGTAASGAVTATLPSFVGFGVQQGAITGTSPTFTWTNAAASNSLAWVDITTSANGARVYAIAGAAGSQAVYISTNNGSSWSAPVFPRTGGTFASISTDSSGNIVAVLDTNNDRVYTSTDGGLNYISAALVFTNTAVPPTTTNAGDAVRVAVSVDGSRIYATTTGTTTVADGYIYVSTNSGQSFAPASTSSRQDWNYIDAGSGLNVVASTTSGTVWRSIDGAANMAVQSGGLTASTTYRVQTSADGTVLAALGSTTEVFTTTCSGATCATWTKVAPTGFPTSGFQAISLSTDGSRLFAASNAASQGIWTGTSTATAGTYTWIGPKGVALTTYANLASSTNGGFVYCAATSGGTAGGSSGATGQVWQGFGTI